MTLRCAGLGVAFALCACGATRSSPDRQGVSVDPGPCGRGLLVMESDYQSSNVSALGFDGSVLSQSLDSSQTESGGFGVGLSSDAALPSALQASAQVVLIDSYPPVLRFLDLASARVTAELSVATGFGSNPHDYLALNGHKAYVARYEANPNPGQQEFDQGADILIVDPSVPSITSRIDLSPSMADVGPGFSAHPAQLLEASGRVFALLAAYADDYTKGGAPSRLIEIDPASDTVLSTTLLGGLRGCDSLALSPDGDQLAVGCTGDDLKSVVPKLNRSGIALLDISNAPRLGPTFAASQLGNDVVGFSLDFVGTDLLFYGTFGHRDDSGAVAAQDGLWLLDTSQVRVTEVLRSLSQPFTLGAVRCAPSCGVCFASDAERLGGSVQRFPITSSGSLGAPTGVRAETHVGLPPRYLAWF